MGFNGEFFLVEMMDKVIWILSYNIRGYFLMVEGRFVYFFLKLFVFLYNFYFLID